MSAFKVDQRILCIEGGGELKVNNYYTVKCVYESIYSYTYEMVELPDFYWSHLRFKESEYEVISC